MNRTRALPGAVAYACLAYCTLSLPALAEQIAVQSDPAEGQLVEHAADEFAKYARRITGNEPQQVGFALIDDSTQTSFQKLFVIATAQHAKKNYHVSIPSDLEDAYIIKGLDREPPTVVIAGNSARATLYAVYDYFERFCDVGYFLDGERIPKTKSLPVEDISVIEIPRLRLRNIHGPVSFDIDTLGTSKIFRATLWTTDDFYHWLDWMSKSRLNMMVFQMKRIFCGITWKETGKDPSTPVALHFTPPEKRIEKIHNIFDYGRRRGIMFEYVLGLPDRKAEGREWWKKIIDEYGTDHYVLAGAPMEGGPTEQSFRDLVKQHVDILKYADKDAVNISDTWGMYWVGQSGTKPWARRLMSFWPKETYIYDTGSDFGGAYEKCDYFPGFQWAYGLIHAYTYGDMLHTSIKYYLNDVKEILSDKRAKNCTGYFVVPEHIIPTHDFLLGYALKQLAWNPQSVDYQTLLRDFCILRFGRESLDNMLRSVECLEEFNNRRPFMGTTLNGEFEAYPVHRSILTGKIGWHRCPDRAVLAKIREDLTPLKNAILWGLKESESHAHDRLYLNYMFELARTYLSELETKYLYNCFFAYKSAIAASDAGKENEYQAYLNEFDDNAALAKGVLIDLDRLLATRQDYNLMDQVKHLADMEGLDRKHRRMAQKFVVGNFNWTGYFNNAASDVFHCFYRPQTELFLKNVRNMMQSRITPAYWPGKKLPENVSKAFFDGWEDLRQKFFAICYNADARADAIRPAVYDGGTIDAIHDFLAREYKFSVLHGYEHEPPATISDDFSAAAINTEIWTTEGDVAIDNQTAALGDGNLSLRQTIDFDPFHVQFDFMIAPDAKGHIKFDSGQWSIDISEKDNTLKLHSSVNTLMRYERLAQRLKAGVWYRLKMRHTNANMMLQISAADGGQEQEVLLDRKVKHVVWDRLRLRFAYAGGVDSGMGLRLDNFRIEPLQSDYDMFQVYKGF